MGSKGPEAARRSFALGRAPRHLRIVVLGVVVAAFGFPFSMASANTSSVAASGPVVKIGMIFPLSGPLAASPEVKDAMLASIAAFNKRGGVGTNHARLQADVCDSKGDANGEVACARQMVDDGVAATFNDLTYNNPAGVNDIMQAAAIPRIGIGGTDISEFTSPVSFPVSAGVIAAYLGTAVGFKQDKHNKICLLRTDAPTGATFRGFLAPSFTAIGIDIPCDVAVATGATDYAPYVAQLQQESPQAVLISHTAAVTTQMIAAMAQLNAKIPLGGAPGSFKLDTLRKYPAITKGTVLSDSFPYPSQANAKAFPGLNQYFADMKASGKSSLSQAKLKAQDFGPWIATLAFVNVAKGLDSFTPQTVTDALKSAKDVDLMGLTPAWTPSTPGFSVLKSSSNHFVYISRFDGKNIVTNKTPIDVTQYIK